MLIKICNKFYSSNFQWVINYRYYLRNINLIFKNRNKVCWKKLLENNNKFEWQVQGRKTLRIIKLSDLKDNLRV